MRNRRLSLIVVLVEGVMLAFSPGVLADGKASTKALEERVEALTRKVQILEKRLEQEQESAAAAAAPAPAAGEERVRIRAKIT